ncbi:MAG: hypothetical protein ACFFD1_01950 [Candidatus Thorarchaeota archaeon]
MATRHLVLTVKLWVQDKYSKNNFVVDKTNVLAIRRSRHSIFWSRE